jgi:hypothetical protein
VGKRREGKEKTKKQIRRPNKKLKKKIESKKKNSVYPLFFFFNQIVIDRSWLLFIERGRLEDLVFTSLITNFPS